MGKIKDLFEKIKRYFKRNEPSSSYSRPTIEIRAHHDSPPIQQIHASNNVPKIKIGEVHKRTPTAAGKNVYQSEVDVQNPNLGRGMTVRQQRKPGKCPLCATLGKVVANTGGGDRWRCEECGSTFN